MSERGQFDFLDILAVISFVIQLENQRHIIRMSDIQGEVNSAVENIHSHLQTQDEKIDLILERLGYGKD